MSKASEYAAAVRARWDATPPEPPEPMGFTRVRDLSTPFHASVTEGGHLSIKAGPLESVLNPQHVAAFAAWLADTFGPFAASPSEPGGDRA